MTLKIDEPTRLAILKAYDARTPTAEIAAMFGICKSYPSQLARRRGKVMRGHKREGGKNDRHNA